MRELIYKIDTEKNLTIIGYSSMMAPTSKHHVGKVFRTLRLKPIGDEEGDIFFFEYIKDEWIFNPELGFINLDSPRQLECIYPKMKPKKLITWKEFIMMISNQI